jgi:prepilin-type N-terminal cleavage/methylation domain-containing protein
VRRYQPSGPPQDNGFTLLEALIAITIMTVIMMSLAPAFYSAMKLTSTTTQRSQATGLAVAATEQMRSFPYGQVGFHSTPSACNSITQTPVTLSASGPIDALPTSAVEGQTTYSITRCVYWVGASITSDSQAYKETVVTVGWTSVTGPLSVSQTSALYPGGLGSYTGPGAATTTTTTTTVPSGQIPLAPLSCTAIDDSGNPGGTIDVSWPASTGVPTPSYYVVYYTTTDPTGSITGGNAPYTTSPNVYGTAVNLPVGASTTYWFQVEAVTSAGTYSAASPSCSASTSAQSATTTTTVAGGGGSTTTTTVPSGSGTTTYSSAASAEAMNLNLGSSTVAYSTTPATAANNGSGSNTAVTSQPAVSVPAADSAIGAAADSEIAEANTNGSSYSCAGVLSNGGSMSGGSATSPCTTSGNATGGVSINVYALPGLSAAIGGIVGGLTLNFDSVTSWATGNAGGTSYSGSSYLSNATATVTPLSGSAVTISLNLPSSLTSATDLVKALTTAMSGNVTLASLAAPLQTALAGAVTITGDYQSSSGGAFSIAGVHVGLISGGGTADLAVSGVGPNTTGPTTCIVNSLSVAPMVGTNGGGVALTSTGLLADETSFQLSVNTSGPCSNVEVGYAPSGCTPGASGCPTLYAAVTGSGGTLYGTAGGVGTVWSVGTVAFTVFTGQTPVLYTPLTQQQVILCTEKGSSGKC